MKYHITVNHKALIVVVAVIVSLILSLMLISATRPHRPPTSCTQARAEGLHDIKRGSPNYSRSLDRDDDGVACES